ncbi:MAG: tRNA 4-thiouridine(8) synthase ThiI [Clostridia bacterium]|nr:tRNA 4-thiouridine(8) synthase ThiI [Clostridia bacterium]
MSVIVCSYGEIHLKGANRGYFLRTLMQNIRQALPEGVKATVKDTRILVTDFTDAKPVVNCLKKVFGLTHIRVCASVNYQTPADILNYLGQVKLNGTFKVVINRADKNFPLKSPVFAPQCGDVILKNNPQAKVDVQNPDTVVQVEIRHNGLAFVSTGCERGLGGLPVGVSGRAICLISGGIDSPVAAFMAMKRGLAVDFVHFTTPPYTSELALQKVISLCEQVNTFGNHGNLYVVPFTEIGSQIQKQCHDQYTITLMRRFMIALAEKIGVAHQADCIFTGENLAQVASQTIQGITSNNFVAQKLPILRPLICFDKDEIVHLAKQIGTYEISILPYEDCCTVFVPSHPTIKPNLAAVLAEEKKLDFDTLVDNCYNAIICKRLPNTSAESFNKPQK